MKYLRIFFVCCLAILLPALTACGSSGPVKVSGFKLNTYVTITSYTPVDESVLNNCLALCDRYEKMFSRTRKDSLLYQVNAGTLTEIPAELGQLIETGLYYSALSNGAFDITIGSVTDLWDFTSGTAHLPETHELEAGLAMVGWKNVVLTPKGDTYEISMPAGTILDLGAIAKGYIADRLKDFLLENGVKSAIIDLGGNILCVGQKSGESPFKIGVRKPFGNGSETLGAFLVNDRSVVSSGTYERNFTLDGQLYHHILNPSTGYPYDNGLSGVTILSDGSLQGDCLSTVCFSLGLNEGMALINSLENVEAIFVTADGNLHYSNGCKDHM